MLLIISRRPLPVGKVYQPKASSIYRREVLSDERGLFSQPFYVKRRVTRDDYVQWWETETGRPVTKIDLGRHIRRGAYYYEISTD